MQDMAMRAVEAACFLKSLANPNRLMILCLLSEGEKSVGALSRHLSISQTALSQHLARLRDEDMVEYRRDHRTLYYRIKNQNVAAIIAQLHNIYCAGP